jgi:hypothetical protein
MVKTFVDLLEKLKTTDQHTLDQVSNLANVSYVNILIFYKFLHKFIPIFGYKHCVGAKVH